MGAGTSTATLANATATDGDGNIYVAGTTNGNFDGNTLSSSNATDFFLTKYDAGGTRLYTRQMGVGMEMSASAATTDANGNVYVVGSTNGAFDGNALSGSKATDFYLTKFDSSGTKVYTRQMGAGGDTHTTAYGAATDVDGNVYVTGSTNGALDGNVQSGTNVTDFFLVKYDKNGGKLYSKQLGTGSVIGSVYGYSVATDRNGNVYVAGVTYAGLDGNASSGGLDFFLIMYDASGIKFYTKQLGPVGAGALFGNVSTATDANGNVYVAGVTENGIDGNVATGNSDLFLTKYDASGSKLYTRQLGVARASTTGTSIAVDTQSNVYVAGFTNGGLDANTFSGGTDAFVTKYDATGARIYSRQMGAANAITLGTGVATDKSDNIYLTGYINGSPAALLDGNKFSGPFASDFFLAKYNSAGIKQ